MQSRLNDISGRSAKWNLVGREVAPELEDLWGPDGWSYWFVILDTAFALPFFEIRCTGSRVISTRVRLHSATSKAFLGGRRLDHQPHRADTLVSAMTPCPEHPDEVAEEFFMRRLPLDAAKSFLRHMATCPDCRRTYEETVSFIRLIRQAARRVQFDLAGSAN